MATPALGPSFLTAPAGMCKCTSIALNAFSRSAAAIPKSNACARTQANATCADSEMTSPSEPVRLNLPEPGIAVVSMPGRARLSYTFDAPWRGTPDSLRMPPLPLPW